MQHPHRRAAMLLAAWSVSTAHALPPAPSGWQASRTGDVTVYTALQVDGAEVRLYPPAKVTQELATWFKDRSQQAPPGSKVIQAGAVQIAKGLMAYSESLAEDAQGRKQALIRGGCITPGQEGLYGEMKLSTQASYHEQVPLAGLQIMLNACIEAFQQGARAPAEAAKPAASEPYPYYKPGGGLRAQQIEAIVHSWSNEQAGMTMQVVDYYHVLLKDGTVLEGLPPVALEDFDAAASKSAQRQRWGKWRKRGTRYEITSGLSGTTFSDIVNQSMRLPARTDERLQGTWRHDSAYSTAWSVARSSRSVTFTSDGRFERSFDSSVAGSAGSEAAGTAVHGATQSHNDCQSGTMGGANFSAGSSQCSGSTAPDRAGTYRLDGYTLTLRYDSGVVERLPFCARADRREIWFAGWAMDRK